MHLQHTHLQHTLMLETYTLCETLNSLEGEHLFAERN